MSKQILDDLGLVSLSHTLEDYEGVSINGQPYQLNQISHVKYGSSYHTVVVKNSEGEYDEILVNSSNFTKHVQPVYSRL